MINTYEHCEVYSSHYESLTLLQIIIINEYINYFSFGPCAFFFREMHSLNDSLLNSPLICYIFHSDMSMLGINIHTMPSISEHMALIHTGVTHLVIPVPRTVAYHFFRTHVKFFHVSLDNFVDSCLGHTNCNSIP
jgi:hypothetical protein